MKHLRSVPQSIAYGLSYAGAFTYLQFVALKAFAQFGGEIPEIPGTATGGANQTRESVVRVINFALGFLALVAVVFVIVGGIRILTAGGNEENVTKGRKTIVYAIIGLVVIFFARVIVGFFTNELADQF
ncbi:MAG TPA: pilin [Candidatus Peribacterales bacterium]|nr:pilin [Candidatus Peribacterales bacterium]